ncbi:MAG: cytochrome c1 [Alphaproteobacteria bacterium]|nr:cytochrome c1 [Alphaproteobacteria bacterium]
MPYIIAILIAGCFAALAETPTSAPPKQAWTFTGPFGTFKKESLQRGFQVYKEVCSSCHSLKRIHYRDLSALGFKEGEIKAIAADYDVMDGPNAEGNPFKRKALPADAFPSPYPNDNAARTANNGALPPDLSLIIKARKNGADYIHALLTGYATPPLGVTVEPGHHYNPYFPGGQIAMTPPLTDGQVAYADNTKAIVDQMAHDVVTFLAWAAEPEMEHRKQLGVKALLYLAFMTLIFYATMRKIWKEVK